MNMRKLLSFPFGFNGERQLKVMLLSVILSIVTSTGSLDSKTNIKHKRFQLIDLSHSNSCTTKVVITYYFLLLVLQL